ncbi:MAG TPA: hypothetical protein VFF09_05560 [archaeon]|nr:hypothetical protein [archaeon]
MDWAKFLEPNWNKLKLFAVIYFVFSVVGWAVLEFLSYPTRPAVAEIIIFITNPANRIYYSLFGSLASFAQFVINSFLSLADLFWVYAIASFIDSRMKK